MKLFDLWEVSPKKAKKGPLWYAFASISGQEMAHWRLQNHRIRVEPKEIALGIKGNGPVEAEI